MAIADNLKKIQSQIPDSVKLVAVSKYHPNEDLMEAYNAGQRIMGESHVKELCAKQESLPKDIEWHFIGHLQTNKVKYITSFISLIHSIDSDNLLKETNKHAKKDNRIVRCLLQIHIAQEESKFGFLPQELKNYLSKGDWKQYENIRISGIMGMATNTDNKTQIASEFAQLKHLFDECKENYFKEYEGFDTLSMGMSGDFPTAIEQGSTMVRVGTAIFGPRKY